MQRRSRRMVNSPTRHLDTDTCREHDQVEQAQIALLVPRHLVLLHEPVNRVISDCSTDCHVVRVVFGFWAWGESSYREPRRGGRLKLSGGAGRTSCLHAPTRAYIHISQLLPRLFGTQGTHAHGAKPVCGWPLSARPKCGIEHSTHTFFVHPDPWKLRRKSLANRAETESQHVRHWPLRRRVCLATAACGRKTRLEVGPR